MPKPNADKYGDMDDAELVAFIHDCRMRLYHNHTSDDISGASYVLSVTEDIVQASQTLGRLRLYTEQMNDRVADFEAKEASDLLTNQSRKVPFQPGGPSNE